MTVEFIQRRFKSLNCKSARDVPILVPFEKKHIKRITQTNMLKYSLIDFVFSFE